MRQKVFDGKSWYSPPPLIHKLFRYRTFSETQIRRVPLRIFSALWDKNFDTKSWHNSLKHEIFRYPKLVTHWRVPLRNFSVLWDKKFSIEGRDISLLGIKFFDTRKNFDGEPWYPSPSYAWNFSIQEFFSITEGFPTKFFGIVKQNNFDGKSWYSPPLLSLAPSYNIFRYQNFSETMKGSPTKFFGTVRRKFFKGKSW